VPSVLTGDFHIQIYQYWGLSKGNDLTVLTFASVSAGDFIDENVNMPQGN
jgi:hypothetical protein